MSTATAGAVLEGPTTKPKRSHKKQSSNPEIHVGKGKAKKEGISTDDVKIQQKDDFAFALDDPFVHPGGEIILTPEELIKDHADKLAFADEPIEIYVLPSSEKFGAKSVDCWVNGKGIEYFDRKERRWVEASSIPRGMNVVTRRKYVENLLRSKTDDYKTLVIEHPSADPENYLHPATSQNFPLQIVRDDNPKGQEWFRQMCAFRA